MKERFVTLDSGIDLCFETFGSPDDPTVLLIMGLGGPMTWWPKSLCKKIAKSGFHVIRFDNRDTGRSTKIDHVEVPKSALVSTFFGWKVAPPYTLSDMADDAIGLLDRIGVDRAHVIGVSMGGMIAQTAAIEHPARVASLVSIMATTGDPKAGRQHPTILPGLLKPMSPGREGYVERSLRTTERIQDSPFPTSDKRRRRRAERTYDRGFSAAGVSRQMLAVLNQPDRTDALASLDVPTVVIHGTQDKMVHRSGGSATAAAIPGAELWWVPQLDHDLPTQLNGVFTRAITRAAGRARGSGHETAVAR